MARKRTAPRQFDALPGSTHKTVGAAETIAPGWDKDFTVTVLVRRKRKSSRLRPLKTAKITALRRRRNSLYSASEKDIRAVVDFASTHGLQILWSDASRRTVVIRGSAEQYENALNVRLGAAMIEGKRYRVREGSIYVPRKLRNIIRAVVGFDNRPFARPHVRVAHAYPRAAGVITTVAATGTAPADAMPDGLSPIAIADLYNFPRGYDGTGQTIAILECGGGFREAELETYFNEIGLKPPRVTVATFPGCGTNSPGTDATDPFNSDVEVMLDIEVAGAIAPGANIVVYFARDSTSQSFLTALTAILHDTENNPSVVSLSWGGPEELTTPQFKDQYDHLLEEAATLGITICASSGDNASADYDADDPRWDKKPHVDFPASSPWVLACGGTHLQLSQGKILKEEVWHDGLNDGTGGGISTHFPRPAYQQVVGNSTGSTAKMRGVPDVSGNAAPSSGYRILCDGQHFPDHEKALPPIGGTSAVAPLWAALVARLNQALNTRLGHLNPLLYDIAGKETVLLEVAEGNNGDYTACTGWNPCTGLGRPDGAKLLDALRQRNLPHA